MDNSDDELTQIAYHRRSDTANRVVLYGRHDAPKVLFVPGWGSTTYTWRHVVPALSDDYFVHYYETREKAHTIRLERRIDYSLDAATEDLIDYAAGFRTPFFLVAASVGASLAFRAWANFPSKPTAAVFICPNLSVRMPIGFQLFKRTPLWAARGARPLVIRFIRRFAYGRDGEQIAGLLRALQISQVDALRWSAIGLQELNIEPARVREIKVPALIIGTGSDDVHNTEDAQAVAGALPQSREIYLGSFAEAHGRAVLEATREWFRRFRPPG